MGEAMQTESKVRPCLGEHTEAAGTQACLPGGDAAQGAGPKARPHTRNHRPFPAFVSQTRKHVLPFEGRPSASLLIKHPLAAL